MTAYSIGVDIGGTFTDCVLVDERGRISTAKTLSTHSTTPTEGVLNGLGLLAADSGLALDELLVRTERFSHGTTIGTNLVVERKGASVGLLATKGHGDAFLMMRSQGRTSGLTGDRVFDAHHETMPAPLVRRRNVAEIEERITSDGSVLAPLNEIQAREAVERLLSGDEVEAVAIALLWSTVNPRHEIRLREIVREVSPDVYVSLSSEVSPRQGEFERTVAAVINSYVGPDSRRYLHELSHALRDRGLRSPLYIMEAGGGVVPVAEAGRRPVQGIGSGPAGGLAGTLSVARARSQDNVIATDMGGTSFEVGLIVDGVPTVSSQEILDKYTFHSTHLDLRSIACGGGSIARFDEQSRTLRVGPESAGADPGPACYGIGTRPTVTDADVVLGLIDPLTFLGGRMTLDAEAARRAVGSVAEQLGLSVEETAAGIVLVNAHAAATLIRQRTVEQGLDPRDFTVYAYGGAGPVHAFAYAQELGVDEVVVPLGDGASTLSAYGAAVSDLQRSFERPVALTSPFDVERLRTAIDELERRAREALAAEGVTSGVVIERTASMRYAAQQLQELPVRLPEGGIDAAFREEAERRFTAEYARLYSEAALALFQDIEIFSIRVTARVRSGVEAGATGPEDTASQSPVPQGTREIHWPGTGPRETEVFTGRLTAGATLKGPAVVELPHTTVAVAPGQSLSVGHNGTLVLRLT
ncbi:hydantoinase/oxoprolinase family protein [Streptomyces sp. cg40]|uniref:hydantoinase/oxoprolinase family protein n=1 Tax=Streptomyces sp. cg40 TaxID=3419764 RepID=UPI003D048FD6